MLNEIIFIFIPELWILLQQIIYVFFKQWSFIGRKISVKNVLAGQDMEATGIEF